MLTEWYFSKLSGDTTGIMYYIIHKSDDIILDSNNYITERNYIESHVNIQDGSQKHEI